MKNNKGFTLIELIAVITLFVVISLLVFGSLTGSIRNATIKEIEVYKDNVSRAAQIYVETNQENYTLDGPGKYIVLKGAKIIEEGYLDKSLKNPMSCSIEEVNVRIYMESDYTLSYAVYCDGDEPPLSDDAESGELEEETPVTPETPSQTLYVFEYTGAVQQVTLPAGKWKLEVWGAQGGEAIYENYHWLGGNGGYSEGIINLTTSKVLYINVGGAGASANAPGAPGGFNGGGNGGANTQYIYLGGSGGGATDIRIAQDSLYARVIVAGGGGGAGYGTSNGTTSSPEISGGYGGGEIAGDAATYYNSYEARTGLGASQTDGGAGATSGTTTNGVAGIFGIGGAGASGAAGGAGGGGGWYGGGSGGDGSQCSGSAGGGSGYVFTSSTSINYPSGCLLNEAYYLSSATTISGNQTFLDPDGTSVTGHSGNGYARITWVSN